MARGRALRCTYRGWGNPAASGEKPSGPRDGLAGEAGGFMLIDGDYVGRRQAETRDRRCNRARIVGGIRDLQQAFMAAFEIVAGAFGLRPSVQRVEESGARQAGGDAVVAPDDRMENAGGIAGCVAGQIFMALNQGDAPSSRGKALRDRAAGKASADDDCVARGLA